jgi:hypothetical protein
MLCRVFGMEDDCGNKWNLEESSFRNGLLVRTPSTPFCDGKRIRYQKELLLVRFNWNLCRTGRKKISCNFS